jgi:hypothetical protein
MRKILTFTLLLIFIVCFSNSYAKKDNKISLDEDEITVVSKKIFEAVKKKDYPKLQELVISKVEMIELLSKSNETEMRKSTIKSEMDSNLKLAYSKIKTSFLHVIKKAEDGGVVWEQSEYFDNEYKISKKDGVQQLELTIKFKFKGVEYSFSNYLLRASLGWRIVGEFSSDSFIEDGYPVEVVDSAAAVVQEFHMPNPNVDLSVINSDEKFKRFFLDFKSNVENRLWSLSMLSMSDSHIKDVRVHMDSDYDYMSKVFDDWSYRKFNDGRMQANPKMKKIDYIKSIDYFSKGIINSQTYIFVKVTFLDGSITELTIPIVFENNNYKFEAGRG